jgi:hypothetical protein
MNFVRNLFATPARKPEELKAEFFQFESGDWQPRGEGLSDITFEGEDFTVLNEDEGVEVTFRVSALTQTQKFVDDGQVNIQWTLKKKDSLEEYGLRFEEEAVANEFWRKFSRLAQEASDVLGQAEVDLMVYVDKDWTPVEGLEDVLMIAQQRADFEAYLTFSTVEQDRVLLNVPVNHNLNMGKNNDDSMISFACPDGCYIIRFRSLTEYKNISQVIDRLLAERTARGRVDLDRVMQSFGPDSDEESEEEGDDSDDFEDCEEMTESPVKSRRAATRSRAKFLQCGKIRDRAFVCKEADGKSELQVHSLSSRDDPLTIKNLKFGKEAIKASKGMIHMADSTLLMIDQLCDKVHHLDLETEKVVRSYDADKQNVTEIFPVTKFAQSSNEQTFMGLNGKAAFVMDPRQTTGSNRVMTQQYATNPQLSCLAADEKGHFVLGSRFGDFRLFDGQANKEGEMKRAKTLLNGLGDQITHVDVTADGKWILGTTDHYIVLLDTKIDSAATGFTKAMPKDGRNAPIKLQLSMDDVAKLGLGDAKFTAARFDANEAGQKEQRIVTSVGSVAVAWDFGKVKRARSEKGKNSATYTLKNKDDFIVATDIFSKNKGVVVAYDDGLDCVFGR